jgi:ubiquinol-cytochrome c reductase cytochrome c subunit
VRLLSARLSAKRRSPLAGLVVLLMGLLVTGGLYAVLSPATASTSTADQSTVAKGRALFLVGCASCHGKNGEGIVTKRGTQYGPPLAGVGAAAVDFQVGTGRMPMARPGVQAQRKKVVYSPEEISQLAAYVASLGPGPAIPEEKYTTVIEPGTPENNKAIAEGGEIFRVNCAMCHNFAGAGGALTRGKYAPALDGVTPRHMYEAMVSGPQSMPVFNDTNLTPESKQKVISYLKAQENQTNVGGLTLGNLGPVSEGLFAWVFGLGILIGCAVWLGKKAA